MRSTPTSARVAELQAIADPLDRAAACQQFIVNGRETLKAVEALRDDSIRTARETHRLTIDKMATRIKVRRNIIVEALRPARRAAGEPS